MMKMILPTGYRQATWTEEYHISAANEIAGMSRVSFGC
jgi:hypothetical protein